MQEQILVNGTEKQIDWKTVNWRKANRTVRNLRHRIWPISAKLTKKYVVPYNYA